VARRPQERERMMKYMSATKARGRRAAWIGGLGLLMAGVVSACGHMMAMLPGGPARPAESEFGLGPRPTMAGLYTVTLQPVEPLAKRKLQKVRVQVLAADSKPVEGAQIAVDGGMPEHGHGLPTRPRVTRSLGQGVYEIDGVRFNMGGWWEFRLAIETPAGADMVTFNLAL
jgi:hypothetical protein